MGSEYFPQAWIDTCDDDGVYYIRQLGAEDGVDFEGLVWYGQRFEDEPDFANVFMARFEASSDRDPRGNAIHRWRGRYLDVPKGRACGRDQLVVETLVIPPSARVAICSFPEVFLRRQGRSRFGGRTWGIEDQVSGCWEAAHGDLSDIPEPPELPARIYRAIRDDFSIREEVANLSSTRLSAGFERATGENLTGTWKGDDGGTYYVTHVPETGEVVWYAESPDAFPGTFDRPRRGWSNVFFGQRRRSRISGLWADVPRGRTRNAGRLSLAVESPQFMRIRGATGGYGGQTLWRVRTLEAEIEVQELILRRRDEGADEPLVYLVFFKYDCDTVDLDDLAAGSASVTVRRPLQLGNNRRGTVDIPREHGRYATALSTVRSRRSRMEAVENATRLGVIAYAIELDSGYSREFRTRRHDAWVSGVEWALNRSLRDGRLPSEDFLRAQANRILVKYLGPWEGWPWGNPDDVLSGDVAMVSFSELEEAARRGSTISRTLDFSGDGGHYQAPVVFRGRSRRNARCSDP